MGFATDRIYAMENDIIDMLVEFKEQYECVEDMTLLDELVEKYFGEHIVDIAIKRLNGEEE